MDVYLVDFPSTKTFSGGRVTVAASDKRSAHDQALAKVRADLNLPAGFTLLGKVTPMQVTVGTTL